MKKFFAMALSTVMCLSLLAGCGGNGGNESTTKAPEGQEQVNTTPLVVGYAPFNSKFSPFFSETAYDQDVASMTQVGLLGSDRTGAIIMNGIKGETVEYNGTPYTYTGIADLKITENEDGTVFYDFTLKDGLKFSDGDDLTIDDVIFNMYVLSDPAYDGSSTFFALPIEGMEAYRSGMSIKWQLIAADGKEASLAGSKDGYYTADDAAKFWEAYAKAGEAFAQEIVDYCAAYGATTVAEAAALWAYEGLAEDATAADFFAAIEEAYAGDLAAMEAESAGTPLASFIATYASEADASMIAGVQTGDSAANISGIQKTGDNTLRVVLTQVDATAIYQLAVTVAPMHYYGDVAQYDYDNNKFGFPKGDLSLVRAKTTTPMGAGPYKFVKFENGVVNFESNANYFKGEPKTKYINFREVNEADKLNGVVTGSIDVTDPSLNGDTVDAIKKANGGELTGDKITVNTVDNLGYGYIGLNANVMSIDGDPDSDASKNLRKAFATVLAVYRDLSIDSYYGERASVINYPISNTSWAAPQATDEGYKVAFSTDVNGNDIYTSDMSAEDKYAAALQAALGYFEAAGYTVADGKVTAAPKGGKMEYELLIPADGAGNHPSFMVCTMASDALKTIGINLIVTDLSNSSELWTKLEANQVAMWAAAWGATVDPDMYQIYHPNGGSNYMYSINDDELTQLIMDARMSLDQSYRKAMYKECLDIIIDWAVELPVYQRQNCVIFSTERVNIDSITPDITTFYGWMAEVENMTVK